MEKMTVYPLLLFISLIAADDVSVVTELGNIIGEQKMVNFDGYSVHTRQFLGIPFAEPPIGTLRFERPVKKVAFQETLIAKSMPAVCHQNPDYFRDLVPDPDYVYQDEDCLYLNIFIPGQGEVNETQNLAVMIYIYGGDFQFGFQNTYNAEVFVGLNNVILVTFNYRLSLFGFLSSEENNMSGNYGLWDQQLAIRWVHDHIHHFGGNPEKVTIFGNSAGAASVMYQALYEGNQGLFQRVIAQSGSVNSPFAYDDHPSEAFFNIANKTDCIRSSRSKIIECLRTLTAANIQNSVTYLNTFRPTLDGDFIKIRPSELFQNTTESSWNLIKKLGDLDFIYGVTTGEGGMKIHIDIDFLVSESGYDKPTFENVIVPNALTYGKRKQSDILPHAVIQQYTKWADPNNELKIIQNTVDLFSDVVFYAGIISAANMHSETKENGRLYFYLFDHKSPFSDPRYKGASHTEDLPYIFGFPTEYASKYELANISITEHEFALSKKMMIYWTNFAKTGNPNNGTKASSLTVWPEYDTVSQKYIRLTSNVTSFSVETRMEANRMHFWNTIVPVLENECDRECECERSGNSEEAD